MDRNQDKTKFQELMMLLTETYRLPISAVLMEEFWLAVEFYPIERVHKAIRSCIQDPDRLYRPGPGELLGIIREQRIESPEPPLLSEPEPTEDEFTYGQWQCRFALWLMGKKKVGEKRVRVLSGYKMQTVWRSTKPRWREAESQKGRQNLWNEFCKQMSVPEKVASVPIN